MEILKLGTIVTDKVTGIDGMLTVLYIDMDESRQYAFQPSQLTPDTQTPVDMYWITGSRIVGGEPYDAVIPIEILGTIVEDKATKFKGTVIAISYQWMYTRRSKTKRCN